MAVRVNTAFSPGAYVALSKVAVIDLINVPRTVNGIAVNENVDVDTEALSRITMLAVPVSTTVKLQTCLPAVEEYEHAVAESLMIAVSDEYAYIVPPVRTLPAESLTVNLSALVPPPTETTVSP